jgi:hypothetical protein
VTSSINLEAYAKLSPQQQRVLHEEITVPAGAISVTELVGRAQSATGSDAPEASDVGLWIARGIGVVHIDTLGISMQLRSASRDAQLTLADTSLATRPRTGALIAQPGIVPDGDGGRGGGSGFHCQCDCAGLGPACVACPLGYPGCPTNCPKPECVSPGTAGVTMRCDGSCESCDGCNCKTGACSKTTHWQLVKGKETVVLVGQVSGGGCSDAERSCAGGNCESPHLSTTDACFHHDDRDFNADMVFPDGNGDQYLAPANFSGGGEYAGRDLGVEWEWMYMFPGFRSDDWLARTHNQGHPLAPRISYVVDLYPDRPDLTLELGVPWPGDPIAVHGFLIMDCGHPDPDGRARTEIHPPTVVAWTHRENGATASLAHYTFWLRASAHASYPRSGDGESWMKGELHQVLPLSGIDLTGKTVLIAPVVYDYILDLYNNKNWCPGSVIFTGDQPFARIRDNKLPYSLVDQANRTHTTPFFKLSLTQDPRGLRVALDRTADNIGYPPLVGAHAAITVCDVKKECTGKPCNASICDGLATCASIACPGQSCSASGKCCNNSCANLPCGAVNGCGETCNTCPGGRTCRQGVCVAPAPPKCPSGQSLCACLDTPRCMTAAMCKKACLQ